MSNISTDEKQNILAEIFLLLHQQEGSVVEILAGGEERECALRAERINDLLEKVGGETFCEDHG